MEDEQNPRDAAATEIARTTTLSFRGAEYCLRSLMQRGVSLADADRVVRAYAGAHAASPRHVSWDDVIQFLVQQGLPEAQR